MKLSWTLLSYLSLLSVPLRATPLEVECLGEKSAKEGLIYLHGLEDFDKPSSEEGQNRAILQKLAKEKELSLRIALPEGPRCPSRKKKCWPAKDEVEVLSTFDKIRQASAACFKDIPYTLLGFSNGGYYAFKIHKAHKDDLLKKIIASSSSGLWDPSLEKVNLRSEFHLMIGDKDLTRRDAESFMSRYQKADPRASIQIFRGGHRMDYETLRKLLSPKT